MSDEQFRKLRNAHDILLTLFLTFVVVSVGYAVYLNHQLDAIRKQNDASLSHILSEFRMQNIASGYRESVRQYDNNRIKDYLGGRLPP